MNSDIANHFHVTFGTIPGYGHDNRSRWARDDRNGYVITAWNRAMEQEIAVSGIVIGAVVFPTTTVYPQGYGCPVGGEETVTVIGTRHPHATCSPSEWKAAVRRISEGVRRHLQQTTAMIVFSESETVYLTEKLDV